MLVLTAVLAAAYVGLDLARLVWPGWNRRAFAAFAPFLRGRETGRLTGASYTLAALLAAVWAFPPPVVAAAFLYHSVGDTAAGWVGRRFGRHRVRGKSLEGSAAFLVTGALAAAPFVGPAPSLLGAAAAALAELLLPVDDNLGVPLVGGGALVAVTRAAGAA
jgi:dolichol kinase